MKKQFFLFYVIAFTFALSSFTFIEKDKTISNFKLKSATTNKWVSLSDYKDAKGFIVIFTCNKCPMAKFYSQRLNQMNEKYKKMGVPLVALNSMDTLAYAEESFRRMQIKVNKEQLNFPYLQDKKQNVAKEFKAANTPQAFVIWKFKGKYAIQYEGAIDDNAGDTDKVKNHFLTDAVDQLLQGNKVKVSKSESFGCKIFYRGIEDKMK
jgi:peroxiredoxin